MTQHTLSTRKADEVLWMQRRSFVQAAAAWVAMGGASVAMAQSRSNVVQLSGDAMVNGERLRADQSIQPGDQIVTAGRSSIVFVIGTSAFHVRENTTLSLERSVSTTVVGALRLVTGAVLSIWGAGPERRIIMPTVTAGIRGTGVYSEVPAEQGGRSYFCNCYGTVDLTAGAEQVTSRSEYHQGFWAEREPQNGRLLVPAGALNHTDEEVETLAQLVGQRTAWQISGLKPSKNYESGSYRY